MKWTKESDNLLKKLINDKKTYKEISIILKTSFRSITNRCLRLGIKQSKQDTTIEKKCSKCGNIFESLKNESRKFCSKSCSNSFNNKKRTLSDETKNKIRNSLLKNENSISRKKEKKDCLTCGKKVKKNQAIYCSVECVRNSNIVKEKIRDKIIKRYKDHPELHPNRKCANLIETYPEKFFREFLLMNGLIQNRDFLTQHSVEKYYADFYFPSINLVVEIDGERWHNKTNEKEIQRESVIKKYFDLIRFDVKPLLKKKYTNQILEIISKVNKSVR
jgi:very-short-patch-repair endonuclease